MHGPPPPIHKPSPTPPTPPTAPGSLPRYQQQWNLMHYWITGFKASVYKSAIDYWRFDLKIILGTASKPHLHFQTPPGLCRDRSENIVCIHDVCMCVWSVLPAQYNPLRLLLHQMALAACVSVNFSAGHAILNSTVDWTRDILHFIYRLLIFPLILAKRSPSLISFPLF